MAARRLSTILPEMTEDQQERVTYIQRQAKLVDEETWVEDRPFRAPHHSCSAPGLVGSIIGGKWRPGEISLAHHGVLFLDETPEFSRNVQEHVEHALGTGEIKMFSATKVFSVPAKPAVTVLASDWCPCGDVRACKCRMRDVWRYSERVWITADMTFDIDQVNPQGSPGQSSESMRENVMEARGLLCDMGCDYPTVAQATRALQIVKNK